MVKTTLANITKTISLLERYRVDCASGRKSRTIKKLEDELLQKELAARDDTPLLMKCKILCFVLSDCFEEPFPGMNGNYPKIVKATLEGGTPTSNNLKNPDDFTELWADLLSVLIARTLNFHTDNFFTLQEFVRKQTSSSKPEWQVAAHKTGGVNSSTFLRYLLYKSSKYHATLMEILESYAKTANNTGPATVPPSVADKSEDERSDSDGNVTLRHTSSNTSSRVPLRKPSPKRISARIAGRRRKLNSKKTHDTDKSRVVEPTPRKRRKLKLQQPQINNKIDDSGSSESEYDQPELKLQEQHQPNDIFDSSASSESDYDDGNGKIACESNFTVEQGERDLLTLIQDTQMSGTNVTSHSTSQFNTKKYDSDSSDSLYAKDLKHVIRHQLILMKRIQHNQEKLSKELTEYRKSNLKWQEIVTPTIATQNQPDPSYTPPTFSQSRQQSTQKKQNGRKLFATIQKNKPSKCAKRTTQVHSSETTNLNFTSEDEADTAKLKLHAKSKKAKKSKSKRKKTKKRPSVRDFFDDEAIETNSDDSQFHFSDESAGEEQDEPPAIQEVDMGAALNDVETPAAIVITNTDNYYTETDTGINCLRAYVHSVVHSSVSSKGRITPCTLYVSGISGGTIFEITSWDQGKTVTEANVTPGCICSIRNVTFSRVNDQWKKPGYLYTHKATLRGPSPYNVKVCGSIDDVLSSDVVYKSPPAEELLRVSHLDKNRIDSIAQLSEVMPIKGTVHLPEITSNPMHRGWQKIIAALPTSLQAYKTRITQDITNSTHILLPFVISHGNEHLQLGIVFTGKNMIKWLLKMAKKHRSGIDLIVPAKLQVFHMNGIYNVELYCITPVKDYSLCSL